MVVRRRKKKNKLRGQRTHGAGNTKNRRGSGSRGGVGKAGSHKHKYSLYWKDFGKHSVMQEKQKQPNALNLEEFNSCLNEWLEKKLVEKTALGFEIDGKKIGVGKILGRGIANSKLLLKNIAVSASAAEKILKAGGKIEAFEKSEALKNSGKNSKETAKG